jgi:hypothetical protein
MFDQLCHEKMSKAAFDDGASREAVVVGLSDMQGAWP